MSGVFPARVGGHRPRLQELQIRDAIEADLPAIVEIHNAAITTRVSTAQLEPVTIESRREWFRAHSPAQYPIWVAELAAQLPAGSAFGNFSRAAPIAVPWRSAFTSMKDFDAAVLAENSCSKQLRAVRSWECIPLSA
jgi:hypothetical protein